MMKKRCEVCGEIFEGGKKVKLCDICRDEVAQMSAGLSYRDRVDLLKKEYIGEHPEEKLSKEDKLLFFSCSKCLWCRQIDLAEMKIYCALPNCVKKSYITKSKQNS